MKYEKSNRRKRVKARPIVLALCLIAAFGAATGVCGMHAGAGVYAGAYEAAAETTKYGITLPSESAQVGYTLHSKTAGQTEVNEGDDYTFVFGVLADYSRSDYSVFVNGEKADVSGGEYTVKSVSEPLVITVSGVTKNKYSVTLPEASEQKGYKLEFVSGSEVTEAGTEVAVKFTISDTNAKARYILYVNGAEKSVGADNVYRETANGDMTFTVEYKRPVKVNFNLNGGAGEATGGRYYAYGESVPLNMNPDITREGYTFYGWSESPSATRPEFREGAETTLVVGEGKDQITLYAVWKANTPAEQHTPESYKTWQYGAIFGTVGAVLILFTVFYVAGRKHKMKKLAANAAEEKGSANANGVNAAKVCNGECAGESAAKGSDKKAEKAEKKKGKQS